MELHERLRTLRKEYLHLTQEQLGNELGVSRSVIKNMELNNLARPEQKEPLLMLISIKFNVNLEWLKNGIEPIFQEQETNTIQKTNLLLEERDPFFEAFIEIYYQLTPENRKNLIKWGENFLNIMTDKFVYL